VGNPPGARGKNNNRTQNKPSDTPDISKDNPTSPSTKKDTQHRPLKEHFNVTWGKEENGKEMIKSRQYSP